MKKYFMAALFAGIASGTAFAGGTHTHSHADAMAIGQPGEAKNITAKIGITMTEKEDGSMVFEPHSFDVKEGQTVKLEFTNTGEIAHEFVMDQHQAIMEHKMVMEKYPEMEHADPNAIRLEPGQSGEIIWTFTNTGSFEFACLIPGHMEAGMKGMLSVKHQTASN